MQDAIRNEMNSSLLYFTVKGFLLRKFYKYLTLYIEKFAVFRHLKVYNKYRSLFLHKFTGISHKYVGHANIIYIKGAHTSSLYTQNLAIKAGTKIAKTMLKLCLALDNSDKRRQNSVPFLVSWHVHY